MVMGRLKMRVRHPAKPVSETIKAQTGRIKTNIVEREDSQFLPFASMDLGLVQYVECLVVRCNFVHRGHVHMVLQILADAIQLELDGDPRSLENTTLANACIPVSATGSGDIGQQGLPESSRS